MTESPIRYFDPTMYAIPFYYGAIVLELAVLRRRRVAGDRDAIGYEWRDSVTSMIAGATAALIFWVPIGLLTYAASRWFWQHRLTDLGAGVLGWTVAMLGWDFAFYWHHRAEHEVRLFWAGHVTHHSSEHFNLSTALRQSWTPWIGFAFYSPLCLLGLHPAVVAMAGGFNLVYQFWIHTETIGRLPFGLESVLNTPSHHRVHHGSNPQYLDKNYAGVLIVWDRMFGSFEPEGERVVYGLTKNVRSHNPVWIQLHDYVGIARDVWRAATWRDRAAFVLRFPGWKPADQLVSRSAAIPPITPR